MFILHSLQFEEVLLCATLRRRLYTGRREEEKRAEDIRENVNVKRKCLLSEFPGGRTWLSVHHLSKLIPPYVWAVEDTGQRRQQYLSVTVLYGGSDKLR